MRRRTLAAIFAASALSLGMFGTASAARAEMVYRMATMGEPKSLDPHVVSGTWENYIVGDVFMGLLTDAADATPVAGAAESWTISDDGLTYTFKIRDHKWSDGMPVTEVMRMCDLHAEVLRDTIVDRPQVLPPGHPVDTFKRENAALREACARLRALGAMFLTRKDDDRPVDGADRDAYRKAFNELMDVEKHYLRKEHLLFPFLEHGERRELMRRLTQRFTASRVQRLRVAISETSGQRGVYELSREA